MTTMKKAPPKHKRKARAPPQPCIQSPQARTLIQRTILGFSLLATALTYFVSCGCNLILAGSAESSRGELSGYGLFSRAIYDSENGDFLGCISYSHFWKDATGDRAFTVARAFGILLAFFTTVATVICVINQLFNFKGAKCRWMLMRLSFTIALVCEVAVYSVWKAELCDQFQGDKSQCVAGAAGVIGAFNVLLLFMLSVASFMVPAPSTPMLQRFVGPHYDTDKMISDDDNSFIDVEDPLRIGDIIGDGDSSFGLTGQLSILLTGNNKQAASASPGSSPNSKKSMQTGAASKKTIVSAITCASVQSSKKTASTAASTHRDSTDRFKKTGASVKGKATATATVNEDEDEDEEDYVILEESDEHVEIVGGKPGITKKTVEAPVEVKKTAEEPVQVVSEKKAGSKKNVKKAAPRRGKNKSDTQVKKQPPKQQTKELIDLELEDEDLGEPIESMRPPVDAIGPRSQGRRYIPDGGSVQSSLGMTSLRSRHPYPPIDVQEVHHYLPAPSVAKSRRERKLDGDRVEVVEEYDSPSVGESSNSRPRDVIPLPKNDGTEIVKVSTHFGLRGKMIVKEVTHCDGSRTVTTTTVPFGDDGIEQSYDGDEDERCFSGE